MVIHGDNVLKLMGYSKLGLAAPHKAVAELWCSDLPKDDAWDAFLHDSPLGHHEQTSLWARVKQVDDWQPLRVLAIAGGRIMGGFQVLKKRMRCLGTMGYVSKGPVCPEDCGDGQHGVYTRGARADHKTL